MSNRLFESVCAQIRNDIARGQLRPGDKLPAEREMAETLNVGRPVVREALRSLEAAGILEFKRGVTGGAFVRSGDGTILTRSICDLVFLGSISLEEVTETRSCLLRFAAELAACRGTEEDFRAMEDDINGSTRMPRDINVTDQIARFGIFYDLLGRAAHNQALTILVHSVTEMVAQFLFKTQPQIHDAVLESRRRLLGHLRNRDPGAAGDEVTGHLSELHRYVIDRASQIHAMGLNYGDRDAVADGS